MSIMNKLAFWKKEDNNDDLNNSPDWGSDFAEQPNFKNPFQDDVTEEKEQPELGLPHEFNPNSQFETKKEQPHGIPQTNHNSEILSKNVEIILAKVDSLKSELEIMNQRLSNIENTSKREQEKNPIRRYSAGW